MQKKNIVIITTNFANGGTERRAMVLANGLADNGYTVTYLVLNKIYSDVVYKLNDGIKLINLSDFAASDVALHEKELSKTYIEKKRKTLKKIYRIAKKIKVYDIYIKRKRSVLASCEALRAFILCNQNATFIAFGLGNYEKAFIASEGLDCKLIFSDASAPQFKNSPDEKRVFDKVSSKQLKKASACIFQTQNQMEYYGKCVENNGYVVKNPLTAHLPNPYRGERKHTIVNFCRTHPVKNLILLVDAFKLFSEKFSDYKLEIYGATSTEIAENYKAKVCEHISELGLDEKAKMYNAVSDIHEKIFDYAIYVSSSDSEGLSNSMLEAMAMGIPCICTDCEGGGPKEMINDGENGLLVPVRNAEAMSEAMCKIAQDNQLAEKLGKNASEIRTELSVENILKKWIDIIEFI